MARMLAKTKRFGRCSVAGHGSHCEVAEERSGVWTRTKDKRIWKEEIQKELEEIKN